MSSAFDEIEHHLNTEAERAVAQFLIEENNWTDLSVERRSDDEWNFSISAKKTVKSQTAGDDFKVKVSAGPKLSMIQTQPWMAYAHMSDYPEMVEAGDWSGIRDSHPDAIDVMFEQAMLDAGISTSNSPSL